VRQLRNVHDEAVEGFPDDRFHDRRDQHCAISFDRAIKFDKYRVSGRCPPFDYPLWPAGNRGACDSNSQAGGQAVATR
jgi:hypothetical protein